MYSFKFFVYSRTKEEQNEFASVSLKDISILKTLGVGGFGRVELVSLMNWHLLLLVQDITDPVYCASTEHSNLFETGNSQ